MPADDLIAVRVRRCAFLGTEVEGPYRGSRVLFIPRAEAFSLEVLLQRAADVNSMLSTTPLTGIYFGAGNSRGISEQQTTELIEMAAAATWSYRVHVEVDALAILRDASCLSRLACAGVSATIVVAVPTESSHPIGAAFVLKLVGGDAVRWHETVRPAYVSRLDDALYSADLTV